MYQEVLKLDRWMLYALLKHPELLDNKVIEEVELMDTKELREGILEYLLMINGNKGFKLSQTKERHQGTLRYKRGVKVSKKHQETAQD